MEAIYRTCELNAVGREKATCCSKEKWFYLKLEAKRLYLTFKCGSDGHYCNNTTELVTHSWNKNESGNKSTNVEKYVFYLKSQI